VHGGWNKSGPLSELLCFDLAIQKWAKVECLNFPSPRRWHAITADTDSLGKYYLYGGYNGSRTSLGDCKMLDIDLTSGLILIPMVMHHHQDQGIH